MYLYDLMTFRIMRTCMDFSKHLHRTVLDAERRKLPDSSTEISCVGC